MMARAMAVRCCSPPDKMLDGYIMIRSQPHPFEYGADFIADFVFGTVLQPQGQSDIVGYRQAGHQAEILMNHANAAAQHDKGAAFLLVVNRLAKHHHPPRAGVGFQHGAG
jgi:hypothetical protein